MCGFVAVIRSDGQTPESALLGRMMDSIAHRGPDDHGVFLEAGVGLGFRRLSILDLAPSGHQPMLSDDDRFAIVFNGEIYNFVELRSELTGLGYRFRSTGDTEVLLNAYREWGPACLPRLNGMWSFMIYDRRERRIFGSRDRFGVKPLFFRRSAERLAFASEIKALRAEDSAPIPIDRSVLAAFVLEGRLDADERTFFADVSSIAPGSAFEIDRHGTMRCWKFWSLLDAASECRPAPDPAAHYASLFEDAVRLRMRSDVPVGVLLSGGMDSTAIICSMARQMAPAPNGAAAELNAFCYMAPEFDESEFIRATLARTHARLWMVSAQPAELWDSLADHLWYQDEPVHSFTSVVGYRLMDLARSREVKVLLNGQGADEVLAGYPSYFLDFWTDLLRRGRLWGALQEINQYARVHRQSGRRLFARSATVLAKRLLGRLPGYASLAAGRRAAAIADDSWVSADLKQYWAPLERAPAGSLMASLRWSLERSPLPLYLRVEDRNSMAHGIEVRLPFMDYRLVAFAFSLASRFKLRGGFNKVLLRDAMRERMPEIVRTRAQKMGFPTAADDWFRGELYSPLKDILRTRSVRESGIWDVDVVDSALERHRRGEISAGGRLFDVAQVCMWMNGTKDLAARPRPVNSSGAGAMVA